MILKKLIKIANTLDKKGLYEEANDIDNIIKIAIMERPQVEQELGDIRPVEKGPYYEEEWTGYEEEQGPHISEKPSEEARLMALKYKLLKAYGKEYKDLLTDDELKRLLNMFGMPDITYDETAGPMKELLDKHMKFLQFKDRMRKDECISCGGDTGTEYMEVGEDVVSPPVCANCISRGLGNYEEDFLERQGKGLLQNLIEFYQMPTDPSTMEEYSETYGEDDEDYPGSRQLHPFSTRVYPEPGDDDYER